LTTMRYLGPYGEMAARHMATCLPAAYASIPEEEREGYFLELDEAVTEAIRVREHSLMPPASLARTDHGEYLAQMNMSHLMAEEAVLAEMVLLSPEESSPSAAGEPETDRSGAYLDRGWRSPRVELDSLEWAAHQTSGDWQPLAPNTAATARRARGRNTPPR
jgi:hypothetical protein